VCQFDERKVVGIGGLHGETGGERQALEPQRDRAGLVGDGLGLIQLVMADHDVGFCDICTDDRIDWMSMGCHGKASELV
jgi:hypothetical protein